MCNDNRNQIVEELRRCAVDTLDGLSFQRKLAEITRAGDTSWRGVMRRVAELIEPKPKRVCHDVHEPPTSCEFWPSPHFKCSECGCTHVSIEYVKYCPNCGAEVESE